MRSIFLLAFALATVSCSGPSPEKSVPAVKTTVHAPPLDLGVRLPLAGQVPIELVPDHLLSKDFMPGGNLADYKSDAGEYQIFLLEMPDPEKAAYLLLDWKSAMPDAHYLPNMGGYFGMDRGKPLYVFSKGPYVAGFVGLGEEKADSEARRLAAKL